MARPIPMIQAAQRLKPTVVLIHGLWMHNSCWNRWIDRFKNSGFEIVAPAWPGLAGRSTDDIRQDPSLLQGLSIKTIVDYYQDIIEKLDTPPIIIGHSFGGLFAQMLLSRGLGAAGVAIDATQPSGVVVLPYSTFRAGLPVLSNPFTYNGVVSLTPAQFNYAFTSELSPTDSKRVYDMVHIPAAAHVLWQSALGMVSYKGAAGVDFAKSERAPLLLVAGEIDHVIPPSITKATAERYSGPAVVEYKEFKGRSHNILMQTGWEEVADYIFEWALGHIVEKV